MGYELKNSISTEQLGLVLKLKIVGTESEITNIAPYGMVTLGSLSFTRSVTGSHKGVTLITTADQADMADIAAAHGNTILVSDNPRLDFIRALKYIDEAIGFSTYEFESDIDPTARLGQNVVIEPGCKIFEDVVLEHNVVIHSGTTIGKGSRIRANSSIGGDGFGFERLPDNTPIRFPHLGGVDIGEYVEIGSNNCVSRGALSNTLICDFVKTDNLVHIAHNCVIKKGVMITASAELSGGVVVGENSWIGPNACVIQKVSIGEGALVGIGAVVTKDVDSNSVYAGNPAKRLRSL